MHTAQCLLGMISASQQLLGRHHLFKIAVIVSLQCINSDTFLLFGHKNVHTLQIRMIAASHQLPGGIASSVIAAVEKAIWSDDNQYVHNFRQLTMISASHQLLGGIASSVIAVVGSLLNVFTIFVLCSDKKLRRSLKVKYSTKGFIFCNNKKGSDANLIQFVPCCNDFLLI